MPWTGCLCTYNFFVSQRPAVIASENIIQLPADTTIQTDFLISTIFLSKIDLEIRKRIDHTTTIRQANAPVDDITGFLPTTVGSGVRSTLLN